MDFGGGNAKKPPYNETEYYNRKTPICQPVSAEYSGFFGESGEKNDE